MYICFQFNPMKISYIKIFFLIEIYKVKLPNLQYISTAHVCIYKNIILGNSVLENPMAYVSGTFH